VSTVVAAPLSLTANGVATTTVTITVRDALGNPLVNRPVGLQVSGTGNIIIQPAPTDGSGVTTGTLRATVAEQKAITAVVDPGPSQVVLNQQPVVTFQPGPVNAGVSSVTALPTSGLVADGSAQSTSNNKCCRMQG